MLGPEAGPAPPHCGEELALIFPDSPLAGALSSIAALRERHGQLHIRHRGNVLATVTISAGAAVFPEHGTTAEDVLRAADRALYRAKREGRDRVCVAEPADRDHLPES